MCNKVATLLFVAFFWPSVCCLLREGPSSDSVSNDSVEVGDVKILQYVYSKSVNHEKGQEDTENTLTRS